MINAKDVAKLRQQTGVGMMDAKKALEEAKGDFDEAIKILRKTGAMKAAKKSEREAKEGLVVSYIHGNGRIGVMLELNCETDFVARNDQFRALANDIAMHIAAMNPLYIDESSVPTSVIEKEREIYIEELKSQGKDEKIIDQIIRGKLAKYFSEIVLVNQLFIKNDSITVGQLLQNAISKIGENIKVGRFARFSIEGSSTACGIE